MYEQDKQGQFGQYGQAEQEHALEVASDAAQNTPDADVVDQKREPLPDPPREGGGSAIQPDDDTDGRGVEHGECCEECKRTCKRNFWTSVLNAVIKVSTIVLAAFGIQSFGTDD